MALLLTSALFSLASCEDNATELGLDLPGTAPISTDFEDFSVQASTVRKDSLGTTQKDHYLVGRLEDTNTGGLLEAKAYLEVAASGFTNDSLPYQYASQTPVLDSVVLTAGFDRVYGSAATPRMSVYELTEPLNDFTTYNSTSTIPTGAAIVTDSLVKLNRVIRNKINTMDSLKGLPIRISLSSKRRPTAFGTRLFNKLLTTNKVYLTDPDLRDVWKGFALVPASTGTVVGFNRSPLSQVNVHYHLTLTGGATKKKIYTILFNDPYQSAAAPRYFTNLRYTLNSPNSPFNVLQNNGLAQVASSASGGIVYAQDGTGLMTKLVIPGLEELKQRQTQGNLVVNRAELIIPVQDYTEGQFMLPAQLYAYEANNTNNRILIYRNGLTELERLIQQNGALTPLANQPLPFLQPEASQNRATGKYYTALLTEYVQAYIKGALPTPSPSAFLLSPTRRRAGGELTLDRAALDAGNIKLRVYYSKTTAR